MAARDCGKLCASSTITTELWSWGIREVEEGEGEGEGEGKGDEEGDGERTEEWMLPGGPGMM